MQWAAVKTTLKFGALTEVPEQRPRPKGVSMKIAPFWRVLSVVGSGTVSKLELVLASPVA
jgi:hypothetical protein